MRKWICIYLVFFVHTAFSQSDTSTADTDFAIITIRKPGIRIYSDAYLMYRGNPFSTDTNFFDDRWNNPGYCRTLKMNCDQTSRKILNPYLRISILSSLHRKRKIFFTLIVRNTDHSDKSVPKELSNEAKLRFLFPEMKNFSSYRWVLDENFSRKEFRKRVSTRRWYDLRIYFNEGDKNYTMVLKDTGIFLSLKVCPVYGYSMFTKLYSKPNLKSLYYYYSKDLNRIRKKFDTLVSREIRQTNIKNERVWNALVNGHFSEAEKKMTKNEWLNYFNTVSLNELICLPASAFNLNLFFHYLQLNKYQRFDDRDNSYDTSRNLRLLKDTATVRPVRFIQLNDQFKYYYQERHMAFAKNGSFRINSMPDSGTDIIMILEDGTVVLSKSIVYDQKKKEYILVADYFDPAMLTIEAIREYFGF